MPQEENTNQENTQDNGESPQTWDAVLEGLPEAAKVLYEQHTSGLKRALTTERDQRKGFEKQLRGLAKQVEDGSELKQQLEQLAAQYEGAQRQVEFYETAPGDLVSPKLAWLAVQSGNLFDRRGNVEWETLRKEYPELFKGKAPPANAGAGTQTPPAVGDMNAIIRQAAGRQ